MPNTNVQIQSVDGVNFKNAFRPGLRANRVDKRDGTVQFSRNGRWTDSTVVINSALRKDEWEALDDAVVEAAGPRTAILSRLPVKTHDSIGVLISQWNVASQMTEADVSISGRTVGQRDRVDYKLNGVPLPIVFKDFEIGERELEASRRFGGGLDVTTAFEASRVVVEKMADMLYIGEPTTNLNGNIVYGLTTHPNRNTGSASGDFGTITNIETTIIAMINALAADNYHGPFEVDVATTQYIEMLARYSDGSGQRAIDSVMEIPQIEAVNSTDQLPDGNLVMRQTTRNVLEWAQIEVGGETVNGIQIALTEWLSGDGLTHHFKVMAIGAPLVKADYETQSGIAHYTGA